MSMKFMTWTLRRPQSSHFDEYRQLAPGEPWYSKNYIKGTGKALDYNGNVIATFDPDNAPLESPNWNSGTEGFIRMIEKYHDKIYAIGMHEFGLSDNGDVFNMGFGNITYPNGYKYNNPNMRVLNDAEDDIERPVPTSLRYLMHKYPNIRWSIQFLATSNSSGDRVTPIVENHERPLFEAIYPNADTPAVFEPKRDGNGNIITVNARDEFLRQARRIVEIYIEKGFPISDVEIDFEKTNYSNAEGFKTLLEKVKNEVCIPTGTNLRVNLFAMTGDFNPAYYGWHDYATIASARDMYGREAIDEYQLMTYDFSWGGSAPGPSTPLWWLQQVLDHVNKSLTPEKTYIGNAGYGRRWPLDERRMGVTFDYKQLMDAQNGMYVHNDGSSTNGKFYFRDQDFIPFAGFNDPESDYQITYLHVYDSFKVDYGKLEGDIIRQPNQGFVTSYSTKQLPKFSRIQARITSPSSVSGNASYSVENRAYNPRPLNFDGQTYYFYNVSKGRWVYDVPRDEMGNPVPEQGKCVREPGPSGQDGSLAYNFNLSRSGSFKVIALVSFPFFGSDNFSITINGTTHIIGNNIPDWYPYITNPEWHFWDCGTYNLGTNNTINVGLTNGASIGGFIICESFNPNKTGGKITFSTNLQKMKKRGQRKPDGNSEIVDAKFPNKMKLTGELLRRPPRPAVIWEDMFGPHLNGDGFTSSTDLSATTYYAKANASSYSNGSGNIPYKVGDRTYCIDGTYRTGFSHNVWNVIDNGTDSAHVKCNSRNEYGQLVLNKLMSASAHVELDCRVSLSDTNARYGIRVMSEKGKPTSGWIFRLNFQTEKVEFYDFNTNKVIRSNDMSESLKNGLGNRYTLTLQRIKGEWIFTVGSRAYLRIPDTIEGAVAYGAYGTQCELKVYRLNISTLDRFEPMEKVIIHADGQKIAEYGEVERTVPYDEFGYLVHTALPGNLTEAVRAIPSDPDGTGQHSTVEGRSGTIFETEVVPHDWSLDYHNLPMTEMNSWLGKKDITIEMKDPGIWMKKFYVGDSQGFSVAYNSDKIGFIKTAQMVIDNNCKGIAMWTLGQEDPSVFNYLPKATE